MFIDKPTWM